jgi:ribonuclease D
MSQDTAAPYQLVDTQAGLEHVVRSFRNADILAVDLEADSMYHFQEKICLIQLASRRHIFIVDPIGIKTLEPLKPIFGDHQIRKVFHGADYDVRSLFRDFGIVLHNLFDTELACRFLGVQHSGLDAVLQAYFQVKLEKKYQKKDWSRRPLPKAMINYAAKDVQYLLPLSELLEKQLIQKNRLGWVEEECKRLSMVRPNAADDSPLFLNFKGAGRLLPEELAVLEPVLAWRKQVARKKDRPLFKILGNRSILSLVRKKPRTMDALSTCDALSPKQINMYGHQVVAAVNQGLNTPDDLLPVYPRNRAQRISAATARLARRLKNWKETKAEGLSIDSSLILNKAQIMDIARVSPAAIDDLPQIESLKTWQIKAFGEEILTCIHGTN